MCYTVLDMPGTLHLSGRWARALPPALLLAAVIAGDQVSKHLVRSRLFLGESVPEHWWVRLTHTENTGSAFGLFADQTLFLIVGSFVAIAIMLYLFRLFGTSSILLRVSFSLQMAGGSSNLVDRIRFGEVTDFIDLRVWPIFNIADSAVVIGIIILAVVVLFQEKILRHEP